MNRRLDEFMSKTQKTKKVERIRGANQGHSLFIRPQRELSESVGRYINENNDTESVQQQDATSSFGDGDNPITNLKHFLMLFIVSSSSL